MNNQVLEDIKKYAIKRLQEEYGYCGLAEGDTFVMINSDDKKGNDIKITIKEEEE
jgi:hypothetical protein